MEVRGEHAAERGEDDDNGKTDGEIFPGEGGDVGHDELTPEEADLRVERHQDDARRRRHLLADTEQQRQNRERLDKLPGIVSASVAAKIHRIF